MTGQEKRFSFVLDMSHQGKKIKEKKIVLLVKLYWLKRKYNDFFPKYILCSNFRDDLQNSYM